MRESEDAFGRAILDYHEGRNVEEAVRFGCRTWFSEYEDWSEREREAILEARGRVLDIGCAAGRHALYLQNRGHEVLAIDNSPLAIEVCRRRGVKNAMVLPLTRVSYRLGVFDTILMLGNNFGLTGTLERARWTLRKFRRMTPPDGLLIAGDGFDAERADAESRRIIQRNIKAGRLPGELILRPRYGLYVSRPFPWLYASKEHVERILEGTGWRARRFVEDGTTAFVAIIDKQS